MSHPHFADNPQDPLLTTGQVAARLGIHLRTVQLWANDGRIVGCVTPGGHRRFRTSTVAAFAAQHGMTFTPPQPQPQPASELQIEHDLLRSALQTVLTWCEQCGITSEPVQLAKQALQSVSAPASTPA